MKIPPKNFSNEYVGRIGLDKPIKLRVFGYKLYI